MDTVLVVDSLVDDIEFVEDEHKQVLVHNHLLNASLDNLEVMVAVAVVAAGFVALQVVEVVVVVIDVV
jgi:hypothetical protein